MEKITGFVVVVALIIPLLASGCLNPAEDAREWNARGETDHVMGRYEEAVAAYDHAIAIDPSYVRAWSNRGLSLSLLNRTAESEDSFSRALAINSQDMETLYYQALSRSHGSNITGALESLNRAVIISPKNRDDAIILTQSWRLRGDLLTKMGRLEEANQSYEQSHETMMSTI